MTFKTRVTAKLGIKHPIIQGGMQWVGRAELASAVSNAGGLGILTALTQPSPADLLEEIQRCKHLTSKPFGVNLTILPAAQPPPYSEYVEAIIQGGVKIVETAGNSPREFVDRLKGNGITIIHKCTTVRHALSAQRSGVDIVSIDGFECAGHPGDDDIPGMVLIRLAAKALDIPIVATGGIGDGKGMAAALMLGAEGISMGTRFVATREAPVHERAKAALVAASERDTKLIFRTLKNTARVLSNDISKQVVELEQRPGGCTYEDLRHLVAGARGKAAWEAGDVHGGILTAGLVMGLIDDVPTCEELIARTVRECHEAISRAQAFASSAS